MDLRPNSKISKTASSLFKIFIGIPLIIIPLYVLIFEDSFTKSLSSIQILAFGIVWSLSLITGVFLLINKPKAKESL